MPHPAPSRLLLRSENEASEAQKMRQIINNASISDGAAVNFGKKRGDVNPRFEASLRRKSYFCGGFDAEEGIG